MRFKLSIIILLAALVLIAAAGLFTYNINQRILIRASLFDLSAQLSDMHNWEKWNKSLFRDGSIIQAGRYKVTFPDGGYVDLTVSNPVSFQLEGTERSISSLQNITIQSIGKGDSTLVEWTSAQSGFSWLLNKIKGQDRIASQLSDLKAFVEDQAHIYGYPINLVTVQDRLICTTRKVVDKDSAKLNIPPLLNRLKKFLADENIAINKDYYYVSYQGKNQKVELAVGIPVQKDFSARNGCECLRFPEKGRLLVGIYRGNYNSISSIYAAMDRYSSEKGFTKAAQPMEAYSFSTVLSGDIKMRLIYPVY